ncbi:unnamed protein product [Cutaneotrichosporon oleaginosum]
MSNPPFTPRPSIPWDEILDSPPNNTLLCFPTPNPRPPPPPPPAPVCDPTAASDDEWSTTDTSNTGAEDHEVDITVPASPAEETPAEETPAEETPAEEDGASDALCVGNLMLFDALPMAADFEGTGWSHISSPTFVDEAHFAGDLEDSHLICNGSPTLVSDVSRADVFMGFGDETLGDILLLFEQHVLYG